ncbi:conjugal transfer protein (plasmid) [Candidatus Symbiopectobacterium sp. 'North America']|uniref:TrbG/VirB9 family P-type conjugative transfer protein n=1 Tax=Candidatus Symbiopectobacterium sp. 'North America' TaxID=2794574 RepID=UPI0018CB18E0|nr:TrbG/VirB9 family P-type conjugative transfer protein [Candidatus Symbiopectobacterium sp. 'North America']MBG6246655.1 conjugal transfer protein [Candidatus Symbiopectobacterium sp. 'North America']
MTATEFIAFCCLLILPVAGVRAETVGRGTQQDSRVQVAMYSPDQVYRIYTMKERPTAIQLQPGETINTDLGIFVPGKTNEWLIGSNKAGGMLIIKPSKYALDPDTNVLVNTNFRTYLFELKITDKPAQMTYLLRFNYPQPVKVGETPFKGLNINVNPCDGPAINRKYRKRGDVALSPSEIWDNGTFTCFRFPTNAPRPVIYQLLPDGTETRVNDHKVNDIVVVHSVSREFRLRLNKLVLALATQVNNTGSYNYSGTTTGETLEVIKDGTN